MDSNLIENADTASKEATSKVDEFIINADIASSSKEHINQTKTVAKGEAKFKDETAGKAVNQDGDKSNPKVREEDTDIDEYEPAVKEHHCPKHSDSDSDSSDCDSDDSVFEERPQIPFWKILAIQNYKQFCLEYGYCRSKRLRQAIRVLRSRILKVIYEQNLCSFQLLKAKDFADMDELFKSIHATQGEVNESDGSTDEEDRKVTLEIDNLLETRKRKRHAIPDGEAKAIEVLAYFRTPIETSEEEEEEEEE